LIKSDTKSGDKKKIKTNHNNTFANLIAEVEIKIKKDNESAKTEHKFTKSLNK